jgi:hypothetical protein
MEHERIGLQRRLEFLTSTCNCLIVVVRTNHFEVQALAHEPSFKYFVQCSIVAQTPNNKRAHDFPNRGNSPALVINLPRRRAGVSKCSSPPHVRMGSALRFAEDSSPTDLSDSKRTSLWSQRGSKQIEQIELVRATHRIPRGAKQS